MKFLRYNDCPIVNLSQIVSITADEKSCRIMFKPNDGQIFWNLEPEEFEKVWENLKSVLEHRDIIISI